MGSNLIFLFEHSPDLFCLFNRDGTIVKTNPAFREILGYPADELHGQKLNDISHPADTKRINDLFKNLPVNNKVLGHESRVKAKNGRYYNIKWTVVLDRADNVVYGSGTNLTGKFTSAGQEDVTDNIQHIIQSFNEGFFIIDKSWRVTSFNPALQAIAGLTSEELKNINFRQLLNLGITDAVLTEFETAFSGNASSQIQYFNNHSKRWLRVNIYPYNDEIAVFVRDITLIKNQQQILALEKNVLELNASALYTLSQTATHLLKGIEEIFPDMICSALEIDEAQEKLYHLAAPRLPAEYCMAIDGMQMGPKNGSCGTAAYHRTQVIVSDIENDPLWAGYKHLALPRQLRACWSTPVISSNSSQVLATFAVYYTKKREPRQEELQMIERTANILRILIENKRTQDYVKEQNRLLQEIASISSHEIRRPVATILGLVSLFDRNTLDNPMNKEIINHIDITAKELDEVIHTIVEKTVYLKGEGE